MADASRPGSQLAVERAAAEPKITLTPLILFPFSPANTIVDRPNDAQHLAAMRSLLLLCLFACGLVFAPYAAAAKEAEPWDRLCTAATATPATIEEITADYRPWVARCVRLSGILSHRYLLASREAALEPGLPSTGDANHAIRLHSATSRHLASLPQGRPLRIEVIGKIGSCADAHAAVEQESRETGDIVMVSGYCHTSSETFVTPDIVRVQSRAPIMRLTEAEVAPADRLLVDAPATPKDWREEHVAAARAFVAAIEAGDEAAYRRLRHPEIEDDIAELDGKPVPDWLQEDIREAHRDFVRQTVPRFAHVAGAREERALVARADDSDADEPPGTLIVCWCIGPSCTGRWPVVPADADNDPVRPYFCATSRGYVLGPRRGDAIEVEAERQTGGFAEPVWAKAT